MTAENMRILAAYIGSAENLALWHVGADSIDLPREGAGT